jgi:Cu/Ag efflux protein CusF
MLALALPVVAAAQKPVTKTNVITATVTIQAIDQTTRLITLRDEKGSEETVYAGPEVKRFNELKVGDKVQLRYYESVVFQLRKPGETTKMASDAAGTTRATGSMPGATAARQVTTTVEVVSVDMKTPAITVKTMDGRTIVRKVEDAKNLEGLKPGDQIAITATQALLVEVMPAK